MNRYNKLKLKTFILVIVLISLLVGICVYPLMLGIDEFKNISDDKHDKSVCINSVHCNTTNCYAYNGSCMYDGTIDDVTLPIIIVCLTIMVACILTIICCVLIKKKYMFYRSIIEAEYDEEIRMNNVSYSD